MIHATFFRCFSVTGPGRRSTRPQMLEARHRLHLPDHLLRDIGLLDGPPRRPVR